MSRIQRPAHRHHHPRVGLFIETSNAYGRGLLAGIAEYVQTHGPWSIYLPETHRADEIAVARLREWRGDGVLVRAEDAPTARAAAKASACVIDLSAAGLLNKSPAIHSDVRAEAELGFQHLWQRGFRHLGYCGVSDYKWVTWQQERFEELAAEAGADLSVFVRPLRLTQARGWRADQNALAAWLKKMPKPFGIFACYDLLGQQILDVCRSIDLAIPDDVAVVGVDDDAVRCSLSDPPLSSVAPDTRRIGYMAAELLADMMAGNKVTPGMRLVPPIGVSARRSTEALAVHDADVAAAMRFIRDHAFEPITIDDLLREVPLSRRSLEGRFVKLIGHTPHAELLRVRVERTKQLLSGTDLPIKSISDHVGAGTPEYLSVMFRKATGLTPSEYRLRHKPAAVSATAAMGKIS